MANLVHQKSVKAKISRFPALSLGVAAMLVTLNAPAQPSLAITRSGNHAVLSWPNTASNCVLQSTTNLAAPSWLAMSNVVPVIVNTNYTVPVTNTARAVFFRLYYTNAAVVPAGMLLIPAGSFTIGDMLDGNSDAIPANVYLSAFHMDPNPVSYGQWQAVYNWATNHGYDFADPGAGKTTNHPVDTVNWYDCLKWCNARSEMEGLTPAYYTNVAQTAVYRSGQYYGAFLVNADVKWHAGYRLPTEAEWEKAARGGSTGLRFPWGNTISESQADYMGCDYCYTNYDAGPDSYNALGMVGGSPYTTPIGSFAANNYGLHDMAGNVWEWCWDLYEPPSYPDGSPYLGGTDPLGPDYGMDLRVMRGGSWFRDAYSARCAYRNFDTPTWPGGYPAREYGFRCVVGY